MFVWRLDILTRLCEQFSLTMAGQLIDALYETPMAQDIIKWLPRRLLEKLALRATKLNKTLVDHGTDISKWKLLDNTPSFMSTTTFFIKKEAVEHAL